MTAQSQGTLDVPPTLGRYEILKRLALGGMAEIFLARQSGIQGFEKYVVVKRILPNFAADPHFVEMFLDEARLAATLDHHNIGQVYDIGQDGDQYFFAMEYLHGVNVREILLAARKTREQMPLAHALTIATRVAAALEYAHDKCGLDGAPLGIVHRDVAPANIVVTYDGGVKLVDFGIARARTRTEHTQAGKVKGKVSYMSPEQCRGEPIDGRSDLFSLGIVLYELTTVSQLFKRGSGTRFDVMERIVSGDIPRPSTKVPGFPPTLEAIIMRTLKVGLTERFQTASELLIQLEAFANAQGLALSSSSLARYLRDLVGYRPEPWRIDSRDRELAARTRRRLETTGALGAVTDMPASRSGTGSDGAEQPAHGGAAVTSARALSASEAPSEVHPETSAGFGNDPTGSITGANGQPLAAAIRGWPPQRYLWVGAALCALLLVIAVAVGGDGSSAQSAGGAASAQDSAEDVQAPGEHGDRDDQAGQPAHDGVDAGIVAERAAGGDAGVATDAGSTEHPAGALTEDPAAALTEDPADGDATGAESESDTAGSDGKSRSSRSSRDKRSKRQSDRDSSRKRRNGKRWNPNDPLPPSLRR